MNGQVIGPLLRLAGVLVELACLTLLFRPGLDRATIAGTPLRSVLYGGFCGGFLLVVAGLLLTHRRPRR